MAPPGLTALGAKGSACDRLRLTGRLRASAQGSYEVSLRWRGRRPFGRIFYAAFGGENHICCELLMKGLLRGALLSHRIAGGRWCRKAPKGGKPPEVANQRNAFHDV